MKKVIFVGGTSYSGSTMLDMILSNDPKGYSLGEIIALFRPFKSHYQEERERILSEKDSVWYRILKEGPDRLYPILFEEFENEVDFFVDSSKNPFWIARQSEILKQMGVDVQHVLIYKNKYDSALSYKKRNRLDDWMKSYIGYHLRYFKLIDDYFTASYEDIVANNSSIKSICQHINIPFFENKEAFWNKNKITSFFGNDRTRYHKLTNKNEIPKTADTTEINTSNDYQKIYYYPCNDQEVISYVDKKVDLNPLINQLEAYLVSLNMCNNKMNDLPKELFLEQTKKYSLGITKFTLENKLYTFLGPKIFHRYEQYLRKKRLKN